MSETLTIELPDNIKQQLDLPSTTADSVLKQLFLETLRRLSSLKNALQHEDPYRRASAATELGEMGFDVVIPIIAQALKDSESIVQTCAAKALQKIGTETALEALRENHYKETPEHQPAVDSDPLRSLFGTIKSDVSDMAENHDLYLAEALESELRAGE